MNKEEILKVISQGESFAVEAKGEKRGRIYDLSTNVYKIFGEKVGYVRTRGFEPIQQQEMVIQYLRAHGHIKRSEVAELCKLSPDQAKRLLQKLVKAGKLVQCGKGKGTRYELKSLNMGEPINMSSQMNILQSDKIIMKLQLSNG